MNEISANKSLAKLGLFGNSLDHIELVTIIEK